MPADGPVSIAYDGSEQARELIAEAGNQLRTDRKAIVLAVWEPIEVGAAASGTWPWEASRRQSRITRRSPS